MTALAPVAKARASSRSPRALAWERDGADWPNRAASRFVRAGGLRWHVQRMGSGPAVLLLHGAGGATHSWRELAPLLARRFEVIAPDLPGHGFTSASQDACSLPGMARAVGRLLDTLDVRPVLAIGHSAGAAIACRMSLDGRMAPCGIVSLNGALLPLRGIAGRVFPPLAALWTWQPLVPRLLAWRARDAGHVERLLRGTGSRLDAAGVALYGRLLRDPGHVAGTLGMMARWDLDPLARDLARLSPRVLLLAGERDRYIAPRDADELARRLRDASVVRLPELGHLAHEERPRAIAAVVRRFARSLGVA
jgi:magnesium chelatase accessory protein